MSDKTATLPRRPAAELHTSAAIRYQTRILNADGSIASIRPWKRNLILDQGLDAVAASSWVSQFQACAIGSAATATKRDSGLTTFSRAVDQVTASAGFFEAADVGRLLKFDTGEEMYVTVFTSPLLVTVNIAGVIAPSQGTVWYVNQTGLTTELKRSSTYSGGPAFNKTTFAVDTITHQRQFLFPAEVGAVTYREIGWSSNGGAGANLFGRDVIPGAGDSLLAGQQYQVIVTMILTISPATIVAAPDVGTNGFNTAGTICWQGVGDGAFATVEQGAFANLEPAGDGAGTALFFANAAFALLAGPTFAHVPNPPGNGYAGVGRSIYLGGSFRRDLSFTASVAQAIGPITGFTWGFFGNNAIAVLFNVAQAKDGLHTLTVVLRLTWGRTLIN